MTRFGMLAANAALAALLVTPGRAAAPQRSDTGERFEVIEVRPNIHMLVGAGGNVTVMTGDEGVLAVDTHSAVTGGALVEAIRRLSNGPIRYVLNTHAHPDHVGGNDAVASAGSIRVGAGILANIGARASARAAVVAHENALLRMSAPTGSEPPVPQDMWPTETFFGARRDMLFNGEAVQMFHQPAAHTDGDVLVFFRRSDVISTGDVFLTTTYPVIDAAAGGHIDGIIAALNQIIDLAVPSNVQEGGTMIIPGHGRLCDEWEVVEYRDMVTIVRDRIQKMIGRGMTLEQILATRPTLDYDARFGSDQGAWTTAMFVEAVYRGLQGR